MIILSCGIYRSRVLRRRPERWKANIVFAATTPACAGEHMVSSNYFQTLEVDSVNTGHAGFRAKMPKPAIIA